MSEAELHILKQRMYQGTLQKARRGALRFALPIGSVHHASGEVVSDPDAQVQHVVRLSLRKFDGSSPTVFVDPSEREGIGPFFVL